jgi:hypothetical protein
MAKTIKLQIIIAFFLILFQTNLLASEDNLPNYRLLNFYETELFHWDYDFLGGFNLNFQNQSTTASFGIPRNMVSALLDYPESAEFYYSYRRKNIGGNILRWSGLGIVVGGTVSVILQDSSNPNYRRNMNISIGFAVGGLIMQLAGTLIRSQGFEPLSDAVRTFNISRIVEYSSNSSRPSSNNYPSHRY